MLRTRSLGREAGVLGRSESAASNLRPPAVEEIDHGPEVLSGGKLNKSNQGDAIESRLVIKLVFAADEVRRKGSR